MRATSRPHSRGSACSIPTSPLARCIGRFRPTLPRSPTLGNLLSLRKELGYEGARGPMELIFVAHLNARLILGGDDPVAPARRQPGLGYSILVCGLIAQSDR